MIPPEPPPPRHCLAANDHSEIGAEAGLRQAQKMEALGRLAGGVAHDFNNLLTVIIGSTEALADALDSDRQGDRELRAIACMARDAAERGADLVARLLSVARSRPATAQAIDCGRFLGEMAQLLQRALGGDIRVEVHETRVPLCCLADRSQLTAALLNLGVNARDAMKGGGVLTLAAERRGGEALITVRDTGEGMTPQVLARALEPFFTTKPEGEGSGLGLSMVHGFAQQSGGRLEISSRPRNGCEVRLFLPCAASQTAAAAAG